MAGNNGQYTETVIAFAPRSVVLEGFHICEMQSVVCFMIELLLLKIQSFWSLEMLELVLDVCAQGAHNFIRTIYTL